MTAEHIALTLMSQHKRDELN